jgi:hypothetical protein
MPYSIIPRGQIVQCCNLVCCVILRSAHTHTSQKGTLPKLNNPNKRCIHKAIAS